MLKRIVRIGITVIVALSMLVTPNAITDNTVRAASIYDEVAVQAQQMAELLTNPAVYGSTSVQYALIDNGEIVISGQAGVYSKEDKTVLTKEHKYGIGSISKMFTSVAVMQLVEQGKLKLDSPVVDYLPEFTMADKRYKAITVRMLLNHSSGLMGSTFSNTELFNDNDSISMDTLLKKLSTQRLKAAPGEYSVYCNDGFSLAQLLVEKVSKMSFSEYIQKYIDSPLTMTNTKTPLDQFDRNQLVKTYAAGTTKALPVQNVMAIGAGGIYSTAEDLCRFAQTFMYGTKAKVLSEDTAKAMANSEYLSGIWGPVEDSDLSYGLGWDSVDTYPFTQYGIKALTKGGSTILYNGSLIVLPEKGMAMAVLSSGGSSVYDDTMAQQILLKALLAKGDIKEIKPPKTFTAPVKVSVPEDVKNNAGYYAYSGGIAKVDISDEGTLSLYLEGGAAPQQFTYVGDGRFYYSTGSVYLSFKKENNGITYLYVHSYNTLPYLGQIATGNYQMQKVTENKLTKKLKTIWQKRSNTLYLLLNEKYSSQGYATSTPMSQAPLSTNLEGYCFNLKIVDENTAQALLKIPGIYGRDLNDITFYTKNHIEYMKAGAALFVSAEGALKLPVKSSFNVVIASDGYAKWYTLGKKLKQKRLEVTTPKNASFSVYDANGACCYSSLTSDTAEVTLPENGHIVFAGDKGAKFKVKYLK